jgi:hypothetical protein
MHRLPEDLLALDSNSGFEVQISERLESATETLQRTLIE